jgi:hypothetical protein
MVAVGDSFTADEYGRARDLPGFLPEGVKRGRAGHVIHGRGRVIYRAGFADLDSDQQFWEALMADVGVRRPIRVTDEKGRVVTGVEYRSTRYKEGYLLNMVSYARHELPVRLVAPEPIERVTNLFDGTEEADFFEVAPLEPLLLFIETSR